jgi:putative hydrolase
MIRNDLHVHSNQSLCGLHTLLEIVEIAASKGMRTMNICDHGKACGKEINFGVLTDKTRRPKDIKSLKGTMVTVLAGIETNILDIDGNSDFPEEYRGRFDLVSAGFHFPGKNLAAGKSAKQNTKALENYLKRYPLDILTHPCIATFPLDLEKVVELSLEYGFALEVNNTNLRVGKTDVKQLRRMIHLAKEKGAILLENSDGHTFFEIGENDRVEELLEEMQVNGNDIFRNRHDNVLDKFIEKRKGIREQL